jgi:hypothetical protein
MNEANLSKEAFLNIELYSNGAEISSELKFWLRAKVS